MIPALSSATQAACCADQGKMLTALVARHLCLLIVSACCCQIPHAGHWLAVHHANGATSKTQCRWSAGAKQSAQWHTAVADNRSALQVCDTP
jgi:hypothetical protein